MANCTAGCVPDFLCNGAPNLPLEGAVLSPWVRLVISGSDVNISVGNESEPSSGNSAVIKSLQFGVSNGAGVTLEIHDIQGGNFAKVMDKLNRSITKASRDYRMKIQFGWVTSSCNGGGRNYYSSKPFYFIPIQVEATYEDGKIRFQITGGSLLEIIFETRQNKTFPKMSLKAAIRELFATCEPVVNRVNFARLGPGGEYIPWDFSRDGWGPDGPVATRVANNQNKLSVAMDWIAPYLTDKRKGIKPVWNCDVSDPEIIFLEDPEPAPGENSSACSRNIKSYIVNGGNCSPVLSFTPVAKWVYGALHANSGGAGGPFSNATYPNKPMPGMESATDECSGTQTSNPVDTSGIDTYGPKDFHQKAQEAHAKHESANKRVFSMEAELRIQGDPELAGMQAILGKTISLVVINPFNIRGGGSCGDWLAEPECNPVYSNKAWRIIGADHSIKEGSYITTLKLSLPAPGSDISPGEPFGGPGSNGWTPPS